LSSVRNNDLIKSVQPITGLPQEQKIKPNAQKQDGALPGQSEIVYVIKVARESRIKNSRLIITVVHDKERNHLPALRLRADSRIKLTVVPDLPKKGGDNAKK